MDIRKQFSTHWQSSTADNNLTLHGFRRFKTTHLLNLRFLEAEIAELDHAIYQAGLSLEIQPSAADRLALKHSKRDENVPKVEETITDELMLRLRDLLQKYDEALIAFNKVMSMDTFSLMDDEKLSSLRDDLTLREIYETRLLRVDQEPRARQDPFQRWIHRLLRRFRYWRLAKKHQGDGESLAPNGSRHEWGYQSTSMIAGVFSRLIFAVTMAAFLIVPLVLLSNESRKGPQLAVIAVCIVIFSSLVTIMMKASNLEMMVVTAAYAAILSVFVSNTSPVGG
ncbi:hypothetical protein F4818DRAFT_457099 [Hypoxylon cercidicola]|nr:hypothetical protein F4818DRAFT_457099 [Hypoxylon cercidicola]